MTGSQKSKVIAITVLTLLAVLSLLPTFFRDQIPVGWPTKPIKLGLDLKGGSYLTLGVQTDEAVKSQMNATAAAIRAELRGEKIAVLRAKAISENQIELTLLNDKGTKQLEQLMFKQYNEFTKTGLTKENPSDENGPLRFVYQLKEERIAEIKQSAVEQAIEVIRNRVDAYGVAEPTIQRSGTEQVLVQLPDVTDLSMVKESIGSVAKLEFRLVAQSSEDDVDTRMLKSRDKGRQVRVEEEVLMTGDAVERATVDIDTTRNEVGVSLKLNAVGTKTFGDVTTEHTGRMLAIILDGVSQSEPVIREAITGGTASITGNFTPQEATNLAIVLRSGALPAPLKVLEERTVGASLGADAIRKGVFSTAGGSVLVVLFMIFYYRKAGVLSIVSLVLNILFLLSALSLLRATLTLPGIAGLGLTIGMAVDSNVIIFERIREELKLGAANRAAIDAGFFKAHWTILDANLTTLLTGVLLYGFGTGPIKGFAVTLSIGVITTIFAALVISRVGFEIADLRNRKGELSI